MTSDITPSTIPHAEAESSTHLFDDWFDPIEAAVRERVRDFIQGMIEGELEATLLRPRYGRLPKTAATEAVPGRGRPPPRSAITYTPWNFRSG